MSMKDSYMCILSTLRKLESYALLSISVGFAGLVGKGDIFLAMALTW